MQGFLILELTGEVFSRQIGVIEVVWSMVGSGTYYSGIVREGSIGVVSRFSRSRKLTKAVETNIIGGEPRSGYTH